MWHRLKAYRWTWLGVAAWLLLGLLSGVMIEQWYQDNFSDGGGDDDSATVRMVQS